MQEILVRFLGQEDRWRRESLPTPVLLGFPCGSAGEQPACNEGDLGSIPGLGWSPGEGKGYPPTPVFWPGEFHGLYSLWGCKESDMTEWLSLHFHYVHIPSCVIYSCCFWCNFHSYAFIILNFFQMLLQVIFYFLLIFHTPIFDCLISFLSLLKEPKFSFFKKMCVSSQNGCDPKVYK